MAGERFSIWGGKRVSGGGWLAAIFLIIASVEIPAKFLT
jgi:hypothetical protein